MRIIICGAGRVGLSIAGYLSQQENHITVIDSDMSLIKRVVNTYDIQGIHGQASQPEILRKAGAETADVIIAVTDCDEVNMVACQVAHSIFNISRKIARIRQREYRDPTWSGLYSRNHMPIDVIISPEEEIAATILNRMNVPGTTNDIDIHDNKLHIFGLIASSSNGLPSHSIKSFYYRLKDISFSAFLVIRNQKSFIPNEDTVIEESDEVYFAVERKRLFPFLSELGVESGHKGHVVICGGGEIGRFLAERVEADLNLGAKNLTVVEQDLERGRFLNRKLRNALILNGSALDADILSEAGVDQSAVFVSVMNNNENNILSAMIAKKMGAEYTLALSTNKLYNQLLPDRSIDAIINPEVITVSKILRYLRRGRILSVHTLRQGYAEIIEAEVTNNCSIVNIPISDVKLPKNVMIISIYNVQKGLIKFPSSDTVIEESDVVTVLSLAQDIREVEKLFSFSIDLF